MCEIHTVVDAKLEKTDVRDEEYEILPVTVVLHPHYFGNEKCCKNTTC